MNTGLWIIAVIGEVAGLLSTAYLVVGFPAIIIWKVYRKARFGIALTK